jgi:hypothetical protein
MLHECCCYTKERREAARFARLGEFADTFVISTKACKPCCVQAFDDLMLSMGDDHDDTIDRLECLEYLFSTQEDHVKDFDFKSPYIGDDVYEKKDTPADITFQFYVIWTLDMKVPLILEWLLSVQPGKGWRKKLSNKQIVQYVASREYSCDKKDEHTYLEDSEQCYELMCVLNEVFYPPIDTNILQIAARCNNFGFIQWVVENKKFPERYWKQVCEIAFTEAHLRMCLFIMKTIKVSWFPNEDTVMSRACYENACDYKARIRYKQLCIYTIGYLRYHL